MMRTLRGKRSIAEEKIRTLLIDSCMKGVQIV